MIWENRLNNWDGVCDRCARGFNLTWKSSTGSADKKVMRDTMLKNDWTFESEKCFCPDCSKLKRAWRSILSFAIDKATDTYSMDELKKDISVIEKELEL